ncbi:hypothetical protein DITRI_Ditri03aG0083800 [Diplodiscus trichospermus]
MPEETVIVGDANSHFVFRSCHNSQDCKLIRTYSMPLLLYLQGIKISLAVAKYSHFDENHRLYFCSSICSWFFLDLGEIRFLATLSRGVIPFGPELKAVSVTAKGSKYSWLSVSVKGYHQILDSQRLLDDIRDEIDDESPDLYIGVIHKRPSLIEPEKLKPRTYMAFYKTLGFNALESVKDLKSALSSKNHYSIRDGGGGGGGGGDSGRVLGGLIFSSYYTGGSYLDSFPFYKNFPGAPLTGVVCNKEIGRDSTGSSMWRLQDKEDSPAGCSIHVCTTVYLVLSFLPPSSNLLIN